MSDNTKYIYAVVDDTYGRDVMETKELKALVKKENDLSDEGLKDYKVGNLFKIIDNIIYQQFDSDVILYTDESYYHTGEGQVMDRVENSKMVALIDDNAEMMML